MSKKETNIIYHSHDHAFRNAMSDLRVAQDIINAYLPTDLTENFDFFTLKTHSDTYIDEKLQKLVTDILYSVNFKDKPLNEPAFIYLLFEHLSNPRRLTPWDIFLYTCQIIQDNIRIDSDHLPLVIPVVVYNDSKKYSHPTSIFDLFADSQKNLAKKYMFNNFQLVDFSQIPDETMRQHKWSCVMEVLMKHAKRRDFMSAVEKMKDMFDYLFKHNAEKYAIGMLNYAMQHVEQSEEKQFGDFIATLSKSTEEKKNMKLAEALELRGYEKGVRETKQETMKLAEALELRGYEKGVRETKQETMKLAEALELRGYEKGVRETKQETMKLAEALELRGYEKGIKEASQKAQEKTKQIAKNLLKTISNLEYIQQVTGLDIKEIQQLQSETETV